MANMQALSNPRIKNREALGEFAESLLDRAPLIERDMAKLATAPKDRVVIADLFRSLHNIKGDAALCNIEFATQIAHPIESLLTRLRSGELRYTRLMGEVILLAVDRLELATEALLAGKSASHLKLVVLVEGLEQLCEASQSDLDRIATQVVKSVTGFSPQAALKPVVVSAPVPEEDHGRVTDLQFFRRLALQFEARSPLFGGRTERILELASQANQEAGSPVDSRQLEAAVYMHDIGMMFLPETLWLKVGKLDDRERELMRAHPAYGAGLLERMEGWRPAAEMVLQHHEMPDGAGYPKSMKGEEICTGAKILAIADAIEAVTLKHSTRGHKSSILRAIAEVNACDRQFAPEWIEPFNAVIRRRLEQP